MKKKTKQRIAILEECVVRLLNDITILAAKQELDGQDIDFIFDNHESRLEGLECTPDREASTHVVHASAEDFEVTRDAYGRVMDTSVPVDIDGEPMFDEMSKRSLFKMIFG